MACGQWEGVKQAMCSLVETKKHFSRCVCVSSIPSQFMSFSVYDGTEDACIDQAHLEQKAPDYGQYSCNTQQGTRSGCCVRQIIPNDTNGNKQASNDRSPETHAEFTRKQHLRGLLRRLRHPLRDGQQNENHQRRRRQRQHELQGNGA